VIEIVLHRTCHGFDPRRRRLLEQRLASVQVQISDDVQSI